MVYISIIFISDVCKKNYHLNKKHTIFQTVVDQNFGTRFLYSWLYLEELGITETLLFTYYRSKLTNLVRKLQLEFIITVG